jgi:hypothetical protein
VAAERIPLRLGATERLVQLARLKVVARSIDDIVDGWIH